MGQMPRGVDERQTATLDVLVKILGDLEGHGRIILRLDHERRDVQRGDIGAVI